MKKISLLLATLSLVLLFLPADLKAEAKPAVPLTTESTEKLDVLLNRYNEMKAMDKAGMSRVEKKALREEMRVVGKKLNDHGHYGGVYVSGGVIIIVLLLIILL